jgi:hypothetical protein
VDQPAKGDHFQHFASDRGFPPPVRVGQDVFDGRSHPQIRHNLGLVKVESSELGAGERLPKLLGRRPLYCEIQRSYLAWIGMTLR